MFVEHQDLWSAPLMRHTKRMHAHVVSARCVQTKGGTVVQKQIKKIMGMQQRAACFFLSFPL